MSTNQSPSATTATRSCCEILRSRQKRLAHNRPNVVAIDKNEDVCHIIDVACLGDSRIVQKEDE